MKHLGAIVWAVFAIIFAVLINVVLECVQDTTDNVHASYVMTEAHSEYLRQTQPTSY